MCAWPTLISLFTSLTSTYYPSLSATPVALHIALEQGANSLVVLPTELKQVTLAGHANGDALLQQGRWSNHSPSAGRAIITRELTDYHS